MKMNTWPIYRRVVIEKKMKMNTCLIVYLRANKEIKAKQVLHCLCIYYLLPIHLSQMPNRNLVEERRQYNIMTTSWLFLPLNKLLGCGCFAMGTTFLQTWNTGTYVMHIMELQGCLLACLHLQLWQGYLLHSATHLPTHQGIHHSENALACFGMV
jgi:hypothetical protein